jgi:hypothetical protein
MRNDASNTSTPRRSGAIQACGSALHPGCEEAQRRAGPGLWVRSQKGITQLHLIVVVDPFTRLVLGARCAAEPLGTDDLVSLMRELLQRIARPVSDGSITLHTDHTVSPEVCRMLRALGTDAVPRPVCSSTIATDGVTPRVTSDGVSR